MDDYDLNKGLKRIEKLARERAKQDVCLLYEKRISSFCNSHSIPRYILNNISKQGFVNDLNLILDMTNKNKDIGINKAGVFYNICSDCD